MKYVVPQIQSANTNLQAIEHTTHQLDDFLISQAKQAQSLGDFQEKLLHTRHPIL